MVYILLGNGFEPIEAIAPCDLLRRGGVEVKFAGIGGRTVTGGQGITVEADCTVEDVKPEQLDMIVLPGGMGGVQSILSSEKALELIGRAYEDGRFVAAICAAPMILAALGLLEGKKATCYPGLEANMKGAQLVDADAVRDGRIITGRAAGASLEFGLTLVSALKGEAAAQSVREGVVYRV